MSQVAENAGATFSISFSRLIRVVMVPMLAGPRRCRVVVTPDTLEVVMGTGGWTFAARVPRSSIGDVHRVSARVWSWGAHGWRGRWLVNGSSRGLVQVHIDPVARGRCLGIPVKLRELTVSVDDPDLLVAALTRQLPSEVTSSR